MKNNIKKKSRRKNLIRTSLEVRKRKAKKIKEKNLLKLDKVKAIGGRINTIDLRKKKIKLNKQSLNSKKL